MRLFLILILMVSTLANIVNAQFNIVPTVSITTSDNSLEVDKNVLVTATARDSDGSIESVKFYRNGALFKVDISAPYNYSSDSPQTSRSYSFYAVATDNDGGTATSNTTFVTWSDPAPEVIDFFAATPNVSTRNHFLGDTITLMGVFRDLAGNLSRANISDLGAGNEKGNKGVFPSIGLAEESINCFSDSIERSFTFPPGTPIGPYTFRTEVVDTNGANKIRWLVVTLYDPSRKLKLSISNTPAITEGGSVTLTATASDPEGSIKSITFYHNGSLVGRDKSPPYTYTYENATAGPQHFHANANTSGAGPHSKSNTVTVTVNAQPNNAKPNTLPNVVINTSTSSKIIPAPIGESFRLTAVANDPDGSIANVKFYRNGALVSTATTVPYVYIESHSNPEGYDFYAVATGYDRSTRTSETVTITWRDPDPAPSARLLTTHNAALPGQTIILTGLYSDPNNNLSAASIRDLGPGKKNGNMGVFPSIGTAGECIICSHELIDRSFTFPPDTPFGPYTFRTEVVDTSGASDIEWLVVTVQDPSLVHRVSLYDSPASVTEAGSVALTPTDRDSDESISTVKVDPGEFPVILEDGAYKNLDKKRLIWTVNNLFESEYDFVIVPADSYKFYADGREVEANFDLKTLRGKENNGPKIPGNYRKIVKEDGVYHLVLAREFIEAFNDASSKYAEVTDELNDFIDRVNLIKSSEIDNLTEAEIDSMLFIEPRLADSYVGEEKRKVLKAFIADCHFQSTNVFSIEESEDLSRYLYGDETKRYNHTFLGRYLSRYFYGDVEKRMLAGTTIIYERENYLLKRSLHSSSYDLSYLREMLDPKATPPSNFDPHLHTDPDANPFFWGSGYNSGYLIYDSRQWKLLFFHTE